MYFEALKTLRTKLVKLALVFDWERWEGGGHRGVLLGGWGEQRACCMSYPQALSQGLAQSVETQFIH
jgi:hypothetical protein